jgi:hypothetical protein
LKTLLQLLVETLLDNSGQAPEYHTLAKRSAAIALQEVKDINRSLAAGRTIETTSRPLEVYVGRYFNGAGNFFIGIEKKGENSLQVVYVGRSADTFRLLPYQEDSSYWTLTHAEAARLAPEPIFSIGYHIIKFNSDVNGTSIACLWWQHQPDLSEPGEIFK